MTTNVGGDAAAGQAYVLEVFYLPDDMARFVLGIDGVGESGAGNGQGFASDPPPGAKSVARLTVRRGEDAGSPRC